MYLFSTWRFQHESGAPAHGFMIEIDRWARSGAPLPSHIEVFRRKIEMGAKQLPSYLFST